MIKKLLIITGGFLSVVVLAFAIFTAFILVGTYQIDEEKLIMHNASVLVDGDGEIITNLFMENREVVAVEDIPEHVAHAFVAIEDVRFYTHHGIDIRAIGRALYRDILAGAKVEGGSTITQQLAKNMFLSHEKAWLRKTNEVLIAMNLERRYSKDEILAMYLNQVYFGHGAYGIEAAAHLYFNKSVNDLTVSEGAMLAAVVNAPGTYSPFENIENSKERRDLVLTVMAKEGYITTEEANAYQAEEIVTDRQERQIDESLYTYVDMVMDEALERYGISHEELLTGGYRIEVPIDQTLQQQTYKALQNERYFPAESNDAQAAMMFMDVESGGILAVQGGRDYVRRGLNRVYTKRSPASTFKPLAVYAPALETGRYTPYSMLTDELFQYNNQWIPENYTHTYTGEMTMYDAIKESANAPAVWLLNEMGVDQSLMYLRKFGFQLPDRDLHIALGGLEEGVSPYEMTAAYRALAHEGKRVRPYVIKAIYDQNGRIVGDAGPVQTDVVSPQTAWSMTQMLTGVVTDGTGQSDIQTKTAVAGKTGTQQHPLVEGANSDVWFVGYTPEVVGAVWMGYDSATETSYFAGGSNYPTMLFQEMVNKLPHEQVTFKQPEGTIDLVGSKAMRAIEGLTATYSLGGEGLVSVALSWEGEEDSGIEWRVYTIDGERRELVAESLTVPHFSEGRWNPFSIPHYQVVAYDPIANVEGAASEVVVPSFSF
ncbi:transglycosylase domain-containing protein [Shouchella lonarensis]|uniref:Penicillin-binding protein 2A n=1 Tax=Shouchella lonarensis TaxID=1464122 RepID=A0A1G6JTT1_9BACI|nr:PBP1A family penicillin-binding protein [Shouchella lonarensis]SDC22152.1 penicillin-binding protein 2A [Shouchella lonarensis]